MAGGKKSGRKARAAAPKADEVAEGPAESAKKLRETVDSVAAQLCVPASAAAAGPEAKAQVGLQAQDLSGTLRQLLDKLGGLRGGAGALLEKFEPLAAAVEASSTSGYVEMKVQLLLSYLSCLVYYMLLKARGVPVSDHPVVGRLLWIRTLLEKLRPVDQRLQYQIGKLLQSLDAKPGPAAAAAASSADPLALRPGQLASGVDDEEGEDGEEEAEADDGTYVPPKIAQAEYTGDHVSLQEKAERDLERQRQRLERSEFTRSLREEFTDAPTEVHGLMKSNKAEKAERLAREQADYEEEHLIRLRTSKKEAKARARVIREGRKTGAGLASFDELTADFNDIAKSRNGGKGKGKGRGKKRSGSVLDEYNAASGRARDMRSVVNSTLDGPPQQKKGRKGR